ATSFTYVSGLSATTRSTCSGRDTQPSLLTRISYQVGRPWMFDGNTFLPVTGMPMRKIACMRIPLALAEPVPFTVPILKAKSFTWDEESLMRVSTSDMLCGPRPGGLRHDDDAPRV